MEITRAVYDTIVEHAKNDLPIEACGYLGGFDSTAVEAYCLTNMDKSGEHFSFDPREQFDAVRSMRTKKQCALAVYHSHPLTPARPSVEDIRLALDPEIVYVIISLASADPEVRAFRIVNNVVSEETLDIIEATSNEPVEKEDGHGA